MATPDTLLDSAFEAAITYWKDNNGGTRAGLIAHLVTVVEVTQGVATNWVDAFTAEVFNLGMSASTTYADFKTWLLAVGATRAEAGVRCAFHNLTEGALVNDARSQLIARFNTQIAATDARIADATTAIANVTAQNLSVTRTVSLRALNLLLIKLQQQRADQVKERDRLAALVG